MMVDEYSFLAMENCSNKTDNAQSCSEVSDFCDEKSTIIYSSTQSIQTRGNGLPSVKASNDKDSLIITSKREHKKVDYAALLIDVDDYGTPVAKKSRGRPKKTDLETFITSTPTIETSKSSSSTQKKRGRPKKVTANIEEDLQDHRRDSQDEAMSEVSQSSLNNTTKIENVAKNGRPKKPRIAVGEEEQISSLLNSLDMVDDQKNGGSDAVNSDYLEINLSQKVSEERDSDSSEGFVIKRTGRPKKKKRGRPKKLQDESDNSEIVNKVNAHRTRNVRVLESDDDNDDEINENNSMNESISNVEGLNIQHEDLRGTESLNLNENSSDEGQSLSTLKDKLSIKNQSGRKRRGPVSQRKNEQLVDKPYKTGTKMLRKMLQQSGSVKDVEGIELDDSQDDLENTICMICKTSVPRSGWKRHKRKAHYNLAWCTGECALDIHDEAVVHENLKNIRDTYDKLECNQCGMIGARVKQFWEHVEKCVGIVSPSGMVTCAVCDEAMVKTTWKTHRYKKHNNLAWRSGEPAIDLSDQNLVIHILNKIYKERKPLTCEKCDKSMKSVVGFLSHKSLCQKTEEEIENLKLVCEVCEKKVLPVSLESHMKIHNSEAEENIEVDHSVSKKRKAANKAMEVINKLVEDTDDSCKPKEGKAQWYFTQDDLCTGIKYRLGKMNVEQFRCLFAECRSEYANSQELIDHLKWCDEKPTQFFVCKLCLKVYINETEILEHLKDSHKNNGLNIDGNCDSEDEFDDSEDSDDFEIDSENRDDEDLLMTDSTDFINRKKRKPTKLELKSKESNEKNVVVKPKFLSEGEVFRGRKAKVTIYTKAYSWMLEFCAENYSHVNLFPDLINQSPWSLVNCDLLDTFLPKVTQSCDVVSKLLKNHAETCQETDFVYRKLDLFEAVHLNEDDITIFCGGPIRALAWLPTPYTKKDSSQILAVAVLNDVECRYVTDRNYHEPCLIQLWDYGVLKNRQNDIKIPSILYSIAVNFGPIWHLEWCPSGCFSPTDNNSRLGLLAVAASDSYVYIFCVDIVPELQRETILKGNHCLKLALCDNNVDLGNEGESYYATKISWSKASGHKFLAVGYSNGFVALFNLEESNESILRNTTFHGEKVLFPYLKFQPQVTSPITVLSLSHLSGGNTWLLAGISEHDVCYWDLRTLNCVSSVKNASPSDGVWMTQWLTSTFSEDKDGARESSANDSKPGSFRGLPVYATTWSPRECMSEKYGLTSSYSAIKCLSFSDWLNALIHGNYTGEISANFANQLVRYMQAHCKVKNGTRNCVFSNAKLVKKNCDVFDSEVTVNYHDTTEKYGLVFCDFDLRDTNFPSDFTRTVDRELIKDTNAELYPLQAINKIAFNPNVQACTFFAAGYQCGFVRLKRLQFLARDYERL